MKIQKAHWPISLFLLVIGMSCKAFASEPLPPSDYFTSEALATADLAGMREEAGDLLAKTPAVLAAAKVLATKLPEEDCDAVLKRVAITERLVAYIERRLKDGRDDYLLFAWQGAMELELLLAYFANEESRFAERSKLGEVRALHAKDFGVVADGVTDDRAALQRALDAAMALADGSARVRLVLPKGRLVVGFDESVFPSDLIRQKFQPAHLWVTNSAFLTVSGPETTFVFCDATHLGIRVVGCRDAEFEGFSIAYAENPSTQGTVAAVNADPYSIDVAIDAGYPAPDSPRFMNAPSRRFTLSDERGFVQGTAVMGPVMRLSAAGGGVFRFTPDPSNENSGYWHKPRVGDRLSVIARYCPLAFDASAIDLRACRFCTLRNVTVVDSPGVDFRIFNTYATKLVGCAVRPRVGDLVSSNADGCQVTGDIGPYVAHCHFEGMEDDGFNFHSANPELADLSEDRMVAWGVCGKAAFVSRPDDGKVHAVLRRANARGGRLTRPAPEGLVTAKGIRCPDDAEKNAKGYFGSRAKEYKRADRCVKIPSDLSGTVVVDTEFRNVRGMGLQADAPNLWFENVRCRHTTNGGINPTALLSWGMNFVPHNIVIKDCSFEDSHNFAITIAMKVMSGLPDSDARPIQDVLIENCRIDHRWRNPIRMDNCADVVVTNLTVRTPNELEAGFRRPPRGARPQTWYHLMNGNVTREGLVKDLDAMAAIGLGGFTMFDAGCGIPPGPLRFGTPEWDDFLAFAAREAAKRDLEIILPNCSGWSSSGGPWIGETNCMKEVVLEESDVPAGATQYALPAPADPRTHTVAVLAYPIPPADLATEGPYDGFTLQIADLGTHGLFAEAIVEASDDGQSFHDVFTTGKRVWGDVSDAYRVPRYFPFPKPISAKHLRVRVENRSDYAKLKGKVTFVPQRGRRLADVESKRFAIHQYNPRETLPARADQVVPCDSVANLTASLRPDGTLTWEVPAGRWRVLRVGWRPQDKECRPASEGGRGLEVDKLDAKAVDYHFNRYAGRVADRLGPKLAGKDRPGFAGVLTDSYEVGMQNWTDGFEKTFVRRAGYDPTTWYPVFAGRIVGSVEASERFLEDYRRVLSDCFAENYADEMAAACHRRGLAYESEPYGNFPADYLRYGEKADIPMAEFWSRGANRHLHVGNAKLAAYLAHVWGRRYVATESFTAGWPYAGRFRTTPRFLKPQGDLAFASGVNRINYHRFAHQPWPDGPVPGMTMGKWGMNFDRTLTWWYDQEPWIAYQSRCQWMLQEGTFVADLLYYQGEDLPVRADTEPPCERVRSTREGYPAGYDYDWCAREALLKLRVEGGRIVVPGGVRYALLVLPETDTMSFEVLDKVSALLDQGAKVCAVRKPVRFPGLNGWPADVAAFTQCVDEVWAKGVLEMSAAEALAKIGRDPDVIPVSPKEGFPDVAFIHRESAVGDWYFIAHACETSATMTVSFRQCRRAVELWNAETGEIVRARRVREDGGRTLVTFDLGPDGSVFVVFREECDAPPETLFHEVGETPVAGPWQVRFPNGFHPNAVAQGPEETVVFTNLADWTHRPEKDINYFSGTAEYVGELEVMGRLREEAGAGSCRQPATGSQQPTRVVLDLGDVRDFATVTVGDKTYPTLWKPPYRVDITDALSQQPPTANQQLTTLPVRIRVTNLWVNRLIGDEREYAGDCEWNDDGGIVRIPDWVSRGEKSPTGRHAFCTWRHWKAEDALFPSGLLGPVRLKTLKKNTL